MKKIVLSIFVSSTLVLGSGIPVVDVVSNAQAMAQNIKEIAEWAKEAQRWANTATHYSNQLQAYQDQLLSATEIRNSVQFVKDVSNFYDFAKTYKSDYLELGTDILNSNTIIGIRAKSLYDKYNLFDNCNKSYFTENEKTICKNKMVRRVQEVAVYQEYSENLDSLNGDLNDLAVKLANSSDIKESQDIGNAIQLKIAQINATKTQVELMNAQNTRLDMIEKRQKEQLYKQSMQKSVSTIDYKKW